MLVGCRLEFLVMGLAAEINKGDNNGKNY